MSVVEHTKANDRYRTADVSTANYIPAEYRHWGRELAQLFRDDETIRVNVCWHGPTLFCKERVTVDQIRIIKENGYVFGSSLNIPNTDFGETGTAIYLNVKKVE